MAMPIIERITRFVRKPVYRQWAAIKATLHAACERKPVDIDEFLLPGVVNRHQHRRYLAHRPDSELVFSRFPEIAMLADFWVHKNAENNGGDFPRLYALVFNLSQVLSEGVSGDIAELGVYKGNSAVVLAHYARTHGRRLFLFDTFKGFEPVDFISGGDRVLMEMQKSEFADTSLEEVRRLVGDRSVTYCSGRFPASATDEVDRSCFAIVHLDCDLYEPTKAGLAYFYPRLSPGGLLILHDYSNPYWEGVRRAVDEFVTTIPERLIVLPDKSGTAMIRRTVLG